MTSAYARAELRRCVMDARSAIAGAAGKFAGWATRPIPLGPIEQAACHGRVTAERWCAGSFATWSAAAGFPSWYELNQGARWRTEERRRRALATPCRRARAE